MQKTMHDVVTLLKKAQSHRITNTSLHLYMMGDKDGGGEYKRLKDELYQEIRLYLELEPDSGFGSISKGQKIGEVASRMLLHLESRLKRHCTGWEEG